MYPTTEVLRTTFLKDGFVVHRFMVSTREVVHIKLICQASKNPVFAVDYLIPKSVYEKELRSIESSIGSIQLL